jgi:hypothetical protein
MCTLSSFKAAKGQIDILSQGGIYIHWKRMVVVTRYQHRPEKKKEKGTYAEYSCSMCIISLVEYFAFPFPPVEAGVSVFVAIGAILLCDVYDMYKRKE